MDEMQATGAHDQGSDISGSGSSKRPRVIASSSGSGSESEDGRRRIFCNRPLNMKNIVAVGFDMDYTLAQYVRETYESLAYQLTVEKLVENLQYPPELLSWEYDRYFMVRGLVLDKNRGNILKMDRHKYVKVAFHGFEEMSKEDKVETYGNILVRDSFDGPDYAVIDTLFSLPEAFLFTQLVDFKDKNPGKIPESTNYARLYKDVRDAIDLCHRDRTLEQEVAKDPGRYIIEDAEIIPMLKMLKDSGHATFLVTNRLWDYTNTVMNFLYDPSGVYDGGINLDWLQYFDVVITGSAKPGFFLDERANLFEVVPETGMLLNTDNGSPMPQVGNISARVLPEEKDHACKVFQGGSVGHLHTLLSIESSSQVLYVGNRIYGDILRSKKVLGWRTMLVIPELVDEIDNLRDSKNVREALLSHRRDRDRIESVLNRLTLKLNSSNDGTDEELKLKIDKLKVLRDRARSKEKEAKRDLHHMFDEQWGQLMKAGYQNSRFAHQVERFACLYTSHVTNLGWYTTYDYYKPWGDLMPHEFVAYKS